MKVQVSKVKEFSGEFEFLSNFFEDMESITMPWDVGYPNRILYPTTEHAYQAAKTTSLYNRALISIAKTPAIAKKMGSRKGHKAFKILLRPDWNTFKIEAMAAALYRKFEQPRLRKMLLETHPMRLEEGNYWGDEYWGVDLKTGRGHNMLGILLMELRIHLLCLEYNKDRMKYNKDRMK